MVKHGTATAKQPHEENKLFHRSLTSFQIMRLTREMRANKCSYLQNSITSEEFNQKLIKTACCLPARFVLQDLLSRTQLNSSK